MPPSRTYIRKLKRPAGSGLWPTYLLGNDQYGTWFHTPRHSLFRGEDGREVGYCEVAMGPDGIGEHVVHLIPEGGWWFATWRLGGMLTADVCTPPELIEDEWRYVDLELDPYRSPDGTVGTEDWDELEEAHQAGLVSTEERRAAAEAAVVLERDFRASTEPFGVVGWDRLAAAIELALPELTDFGDQPIHPLRG